MTTILLSAALVATNLPPVVVEASRLDTAQALMPASVQVIGRDEIASSGAHTATELLARKCPQLHLRQQGAGNPALAEFALRGFGENGHGRTLVLVDGERLNAPDLNMPDLSRIALGSASRIEVIGGPQTVLHGDGASAGVINVVTEPQSDEQETRAEVRGGSWGTFGASLSTRGGLADEGLKYWADGAWSRSDGYRSQSQYNIWNADGGLKKTWESGTSLRLSAFYNDAQYDLPGYLTYDEWQADPRRSNVSNDRYHRAAYGFNAVFNARLNAENALKTTATFSNRKMWTYQDTFGWITDNEYDIYSCRLTKEWINTSELAGFENEFLLGAEYAFDLLNGAQVGSADDQFPTYDRHAMDFFVQDTFRLVDEFAIVPGARYSRTWAFNNLCERKHRADHLAAFDVSLVYNPVETAKIYLKGSRFYRNPFLDETPGRYDAGYSWVQTEILEPERGWNAELGFDWTFGEFACGGDAYVSWLEDEIFYDAIHSNNVNSDDPTFRRGVDLHVGWEREKVAGVTLAASVVGATFEGDTYGRNLIPLVPGVTCSANGRVFLWDECFVFGGYRFQDTTVTCSDFENAYARLEAFGLFHIGATYEPTFADWARGFSVTLTVDNLLDAKYCDYATYGRYYWPGAGRSFTVAVRYAF